MSPIVQSILIFVSVLTCCWCGRVALPTRARGDMLIINGLFSFLINDVPGVGWGVCVPTGWDRVVNLYGPQNKTKQKQIIIIIIYIYVYM